MMTPERIGEYNSISVTISSFGYEMRDWSFSLEVLPITINIHWSQDTVRLYEGTDLVLLVSLYEEYTNKSITGALVQYIIIEQPSISGVMTDLGNGNYTATIATRTLFPGPYTIRISVTLGSNYESLDYSQTRPLPVFVETNIPFRASQLLAILVVVLLVLISGYITRRQLKKRRAILKSKMLATRQEFEDARNIIAVLVIMRESGLPFFATQTREDMESGLVASFIAAVTHFRKQVITKDDEDLFKPIPISDIVHICPTRNLLCAFVTLMPPSQRMFEKNSRIHKESGPRFWSPSS